MLTNYSNGKIGIIGFGSVGQQLYQMLIQNEVEPTDIVIFADDALGFEGSEVYSFHSYIKENYKDLHFIPALGYLSVGIKDIVHNRLTELNRRVISFIHPKAFINDDSNIGNGVIIYPLCNIDFGVTVESGAILHNSVVVSHHTKIEKNCYLSPGVIVAGNTVVGKNSFIGAGSVLANGIRIGERCKIGMGTNLTKSLGKDTRAIGNPVKIVHDIRLT